MLHLPDSEGFVQETDILGDQGVLAGQTLLLPLSRLLGTLRVDCRHALKSLLILRTQQSAQDLVHLPNLLQSQSVPESCHLLCTLVLVPYALEQALATLVFRSLLLYLGEPVLTDLLDHLSLHLSTGSLPFR